MPSINNVQAALERFEGTSLFVSPERCCMVRNRNADCNRCADVCPTGAITVASNTLSVTPDLCVACGTCTTVCPTNALLPAKPSDKELMGAVRVAFRASHKRPIFICEKAVQKLEAQADEEFQEQAGIKERLGKRTYRAFDYNQVVGLTCLGRLNAETLVGIARRGAEEITMVTEDCDACKLRNGGLVCADICNAVATVLDAVGSKTAIKLEDELPAYARLTREEAMALPRIGADIISGEGRRGFFSEMRNQTVAMASSEFKDQTDKIFGATDQAEDNIISRLKVSKDGNMPRYVLARRERLLEDMDTIDNGRLYEQGHPKEIETPLWARVAIDADSCKGCRMCATFCPTGALEKFGDKDDVQSKGYGVEHYTGECTACGTCQSVCLTGALALEPIVDITAMLDGQKVRYDMKPRSKQDQWGSVPESWKNNG